MQNISSFFLKNNIITCYLLLHAMCVEIIFDAGDEGEIYMDATVYDMAHKISLFVWPLRII